MDYSALLLQQISIYWIAERPHMKSVWILKSEKVMKKVLFF